MFDNYKNLLEKIDAFVAGVMQKHHSSFKCAPTCSKCCVSGIKVWRVEADHIRKRFSLLESRVTNDESRKNACCFLNEKNLCAIYEARPMVCRLWGAPLMIPKGREGEWGIRDNATRTRDTGTLICCDLNFRDNLRFEDLPQADALSVDIAVTTLAAINHVYCTENGFDAAERIALSALLEEAR